MHNVIITNSKIIIFFMQVYFILDDFHFNMLFSKRQAYFSISINHASLNIIRIQNDIQNL